MSACLRSSATDVPQSELRRGLGVEDRRVGIRRAAELEDLRIRARLELTELALARAPPLADPAELRRRVQAAPIELLPILRERRGNLVELAAVRLPRLHR